MGSSGYLAAKSEREVYEHEIAIEAEEIRLMPDVEADELALLYEARGVSAEQARRMADQAMRDPERALEEKVREELGIGEPHLRLRPNGSSLHATWQEAAMPTTKRIIETLGGPRALRGKVGTLRDLKAKLREGLPYATFETLSARFAIDTKEMTVVLAVPERTLARRKKQRRFRADESDRLFRLGRIAALAEEVLGSSEKASRWLHAPNRALGNEPPLRQVDTDIGARQVEDVLLRIAHGVYS